MTNEIQRARDVLGKWRESAGPSAWDIFEMWGPEEQFVRVSNATDHVTDTHRDFMGLIGGTAGNPDLLDAIDGLLAVADGPGTAFTDQRVAAERIAAAILAADERMNA